MRSFIALVQNEWMKMNGKRYPLFFYGIILLVVIFIAMITTESSPSLFVFVHEIIVKFDFSLYIAIIIFSVHIILEEYREGTIKQLLIRPIGRAKILLSKMVAIMLFILSLYVVMIGCSLLIGICWFGFIPGNITFGDTIQFITFKLPDLLFYEVLTILFIVSTRSGSWSSWVPMMIKILNPLLIGVFSENLWYKFLIFPHLNWTPYFVAHIPYPGASLLFSIMIYSVYMIVLVALALFIFKRQDIA